MSNNVKDVMQPQNTDTKISFWQNKNHRRMFQVGAAIFILGLIWLGIASSWSEARVTDIQAAAGNCKSNEQFYALSYTVDNKDYVINSCLPSASMGTVLYFPPNPSIATINTATVNKVLAWGAMIFGAVFMFGAAFLRDPRPGELGYEDPTDDSPTI